MKIPRSGILGLIVTAMILAIGWVWGTRVASLVRLPKIG